MFRTAFGCRRTPHAPFVCSRRWLAQAERLLFPFLHKRGTRCAWSGGAIATNVGDVRNENLAALEESGFVRFAYAAWHDFDVVAELFAALHAFNSDLDPCFALADDWREVLAADFERTHATGQTLWLLVWHGAEPVGLLIVSTHTDSPLFRHRRWAELSALYVKPAWRGSGVAARLVDYARDWASERGFSRLQLYVTASNERARQFYARCGLYPIQTVLRMDIDPDAC